MELQEAVKYCKGLIGHFEDEGDTWSASAIQVVVKFLISVLELPEGWPEKIELTHIDPCPCQYCIKGKEYNYAIDRCRQAPVLFSKRKKRRRKFMEREHTERLRSSCKRSERKKQAMNEEINCERCYDGKSEELEDQVMNKTGEQTFKEELTHLINKHCIEKQCDMPDFLLAAMIVRLIDAIGEPVKKTLDWHGKPFNFYPASGR